MATKVDYHAKLTINDLPSMDDYQIDKMIGWLESFKDIKKEDKSNFSKKYTCKFMK